MANNASSNKKPTVVYVERKPDRSLLWFILFGWWWVAWAVAKWAFNVVMWPVRFGAKAGWKTLVEWPWRASVLAVRWTVRGIQALYSRYGTRR